MSIVQEVSRSVSQRRAQNDFWKCSLELSWNVDLTDGVQFSTSVLVKGSLHVVVGQQVCVCVCGGGRWKHLEAVSDLRLFHLGKEVTPTMSYNRRFEFPNCNCCTTRTPPPPPHPQIEIFYRHEAWFDHGAFFLQRSRTSKLFSSDRILIMHLK